MGARVVRVPRPLTDAKRAVQKAEREQWENLLDGQIRQAGFEEPAREVVFSNTRRWRFDFAWPARKVAVEIEGGIWTGGRHTRAAGFEEDCIKYDAAALDGWLVLRVTPAMVERFQALALVEAALKVRTGAAMDE